MPFATCDNSRSKDPRASSKHVHIEPKPNKNHTGNSTWGLADEDKKAVRVYLGKAVTCTYINNFRFEKEQSNHS